MYLSSIACIVDCFKIRLYMILEGVPFQVFTVALLLFMTSDRMCILNYKFSISSPNSVHDHMSELSNQEDSN